MPLILASSSPYRKQLLERLDIPFSCFSPDIDESRLADETPQQLVRRLAVEKAQAVADHHSKALIIGSDQVAALDNEILTKPGNRTNAIKQLQRQSGQTVNFLTSICVLNAETDSHRVALATTQVQFRPLTAKEIERYVDKEQPWDCAGSFKSEAYGITLVASICAQDMTALIGLPLLKTVELLRLENYILP